ncbi:MAG: hypothetical protein ABH883_03685, partial [Candidatus Omnitrophota bacterium]
MKKLVIAVFIFMFFSIVSVALAFLMIDSFVHRSFEYELSVGDRVYGSVKVDRYNTENKIVYKSYAEYPFSLGYPAESERLYIDKNIMTPGKFVRESMGSKGQKVITFLLQNGENCNYIYFNPPKQIILKDFPTGRKTMVFSPDDVMLYMPLMEKYNYWHKGTQFFEVMIPVDEAVPIMRDKIEIRYNREEYITVMGNKVEAESYIVRSGGIPEAIVYVSDNFHKVLLLEIPGEGIRYILTKYLEGPSKRILPAVEKIKSFFKFKRSVAQSIQEGEACSLGDFLNREKTPVKSHLSNIYDVKGSKDVFFENGNLLLSGRIWIPGEAENMPAIILIPDDGPMTNGEHVLLNSLGTELSSLGFAVLMFDKPGQGKSQGAYADLGEQRRVNNVLAAISFLRQDPHIRKDAITLLGYKGGGYFSMKAAAVSDSVSSCILLGLPFSFEKNILNAREKKEVMKALLKDKHLGMFDDNYMDMVTAEIMKNLETIRQSEETFRFFMGMQISLSEYREYIDRKIFETTVSLKKPMLLITGKDEDNYNVKVVNALKEALSRANKKDKLVVISKLGEY